MTFSDDERRRLIGDTQVNTLTQPKFERSGIAASLMGMLAGLGMLVLLIAALSAAAILLSLEFDLMNADAREMSIVGIVVAALVILASTLIGGFVAGRIARYSGLTVGISASLWLILVLLLFAGGTLLLGAISGTFEGFDLADRLSRFDSANLTAAAALTAGGLFVLALLGGLTGGRLGETKEKSPATVVDIREDEGGQPEAGMERAEPDQAEPELNGPSEEPTRVDEPEAEPLGQALSKQSSVQLPPKE